VKQLIIVAGLIMFTAATSGERKHRAEPDIKTTISRPAERLDNSITKLDSSLNILIEKL